MIGLPHLAVAVTAALTPMPMYGCGDGMMGVNLVATPTVKAELRDAYLAVHPHVMVGAPRAGRTYYGDEEGIRYAVATFGVHPTIFRADARGRWHVIRDTHGAICKNYVPPDLLAATWWLNKRNKRCYEERV
jgi:hypothetical protein